ncbi:hypothetical protein [Pigmentiphaga litoralis]|uniref:hypothetical protein n=1 Tax=Pigmentiphaga litoralis TaxID=516702 RepID=UPI0027E4FDFD|nr:hypothetical protein [Pigmentiphaga litoralis]
MHPHQHVAERIWLTPLQFSRVRDGVDAAANPALVLFCVCLQRGKLANAGVPVAEHHGLECHVARLWMQGLGDQMVKRIQKAVFKGGVGLITAFTCHSRQLDGHGNVGLRG